MRVSRQRVLLWMAFVVLLSLSSRGGSGPYRVAVVVNDNSRESQELGQYYQEARGIPESQVIHVATTTNDTISLANFEAQIFQPLTNQLAGAGLDGQVDTIVYTRGMPYRVLDGHAYNGITAVTHYGFKTYPHPTNSICSLPDETANPYYAAEQAFADRMPAGVPFLSTMLTAWDLGQARELVDRSAIADGIAPASQVLYLHSSDVNRNVRWPQTEGADFTRRLFNPLQTGTFLTPTPPSGKPTSWGI